MNKWKFINSDSTNRERTRPLMDSSQNSISYQNIVNLLTLTEILSQLIQNCKSNRLRRRALRESDNQLAGILALGRTLEMAGTQASVTEKTEHVNAVQMRNPKPRF